MIVQSLVAFGDQPLLFVPLLLFRHYAGVNKRLCEYPPFVVCEYMLMYMMCICIYMYTRLFSYVYSIVCIYIYTHTSLSLYVPAYTRTCLCLLGCL